MASTFIRLPLSGSGGGGGSGDVVGPASSVDNAVARYNGTSGVLIQNSAVTIDDSGNIAGAGTLNTHTIPGGTGTLALTSDITSAPVDSVNTQTGAVVLDADDISDAATTNKFVTASDITNLGNLSGTNTGDQDLSPLTTGAASSTDNAVARFDSTTGKIIQNSVVLIDDSGNITGVGTVDGRDIATDGTKLDGIETGATADQTAGEIKTAYESNADTNAFTDADETKLDGIEALADVTDETNVVAALDGASLTGATIASSDLIIFQDSDDSNNIKTDSAQDIADLKVTELSEDTTPQLGGDLDLNGNALDFPTTPNISDVLDEDNMASDSATALATQQSIKAYVDSIANGLKWKTPVELATTANITLSGEQTIDGTLTSTDRVLVKDQTNSEDNGIYVTAAGAWSRSTDADSAAEVSQAATIVLSGTANEGLGFVQPDTITTLGTDLQPWVNFNNSMYSAGTGIALTSTTFSLDINGLSTPTGVDALTDEFPVYNQADSGVRKITGTELKTVLNIQLVDDTTPQLGGNLDLNSNTLTFPTTSGIDDVIDDDTMATADDKNLATAESIKAYVDNNASDMDTDTVVYKTQYVDAGAMKPATTSGAALADVETTTNARNFYAFDFDAAADESVEAKMVLPEAWDGTNIKVKFHWTDGATAGSGDVVWAVAAVPVGNDDAIDAATLTAATVTDTFIATGDLHTTATTTDLTMTGHAAGDMVFFKVSRDADNGSDTYTQDARLLGLTVQIGESNDGAEW